MSTGSTISFGGVRAWRRQRGARTSRPPPPARIEWLPAHATELNPVEQILNHGNHADLANLSPNDADDLCQHVLRPPTRQRCRPNLIASFFDHAGLAL